jgi:hypothetical protein
MSTLELFLPLAKVDLDRRIVHGVATAEAPDRGGEICDYASTKPYFEAWSAEAHSASGGKSLGAVRAMHGRVAAGKLTDISFDDGAKRILVAAKIVDEDEWLKVTEGVYTGFSQGGRYIKRWPDRDTGLTRFTAEPTEISLVDLPCLPGATFEVVKDGVVEKRAFAPRASEGPSAVDPPEAPGAGGEEPRAEPTEAPSPAPSRTPDLALAKAAAALSLAAEKLQRAVDENTALRKSLTDLPPSIDALAKRVAALEAQPAPARAALRSLNKSADWHGDSPIDADAAIKHLAGLPAQERALALTKISLANPLPPRF